MRGTVSQRFPCPGKNVCRLEILQKVQDLMIARHAGEHPAKPVP
jgi:hypothetical protein